MSPTWPFRGHSIFPQGFTGGEGVAAILRRQSSKPWKENFFLLLVLTGVKPVGAVWPGCPEPRRGHRIAFVFSDHALQQAKTGPPKSRSYSPPTARAGRAWNSGTAPERKTRSPPGWNVAYSQRHRLAHSEARTQLMPVPRSRFAAQPFKECDALATHFVMGQLRFAGKIVKMLDKRAHKSSRCAGSISLAI